MVVLAFNGATLAQIVIGNLLDFGLFRLCGLSKIVKNGHHVSLVH